MKSAIDTRQSAIKYEDLCAPGTVRDPNSGELKSSDAEFKKSDNLQSTIGNSESIDKKKVEEAQ